MDGQEDAKVAISTRGITFGWNLLLSLGGAILMGWLSLQLSPLQQNDTLFNSRLERLEKDFNEHRQHAAQDTQRHHELDRKIDALRYKLDEMAKRPSAANH